MAKKEKKAKVEPGEVAEDDFAHFSSDDGQEVASPTSASPETSSSKKRKRSSAPTDELEIDVNLPEPPSKKPSNVTVAGASGNGAELAISDNTHPKDTGAAVTEKEKNPEKRSAHGIWIGNLPFSCDKAMLRTFFLEKAGIVDSEITRVHMPTPGGGAADAKRGLKPQNKGFAYVDFNAQEVVQRAIGCSEQLMTGRRVLIKDAKSFEGRPEKSAAATANGESGEGVGAKTSAAVGGSTKPPSKRVFVGNLGFDVTKEDLETHFSQAGEIEDVHMATFEDTGKCKGFAWVRFVEIEAAEAAVRGFIFKQDEEEEEEDAESSSSSEYGEENEDEDKKPSKNASKKKKKKAKKQKKPRKWFINRLLGRPLRCEFAEDASTRYKKRFGKNANSESKNSSRPDWEIPADAAEAADVEGAESAKRRRTKGDKEQREEQRKRKHVDARNIRPGAALANAPRASGAIVAGAGKKISFDD
ncbi:Nucleolar protein 13 [Taxawa tesnikishii (nom. ined.)]|nr:Nucleolar protein 13 [Dothideales sp. JES 119]